MTAPPRENLLTLDSHLQSCKDLPEPGLASVLSAIALACKVVAYKVRRARIEDVLGDAGDTNIFGERQQKLDVMADEMLTECLARVPSMGLVASEEADEARVLRLSADGGRFCVCMDPLDGSSNVDLGVPVGTIFGVLRVRKDADPLASLLRPGVEQIAAGYVLYGSSVLFVLSTGTGVDMFVLDPSLGDFVRVSSGLRIPEQYKMYSINEGYFDDLPVPYQRYLQAAHAGGYSGRYIGSMVADVHRTLLKGGVFLYPPTAKNPEGKLRLLYEANPMAFLIEQAGGVSAAGLERTLDIQPAGIHQRVPVILGSPGEVERVTRELEQG